jgi:hypothetical protein
MKNIFAALREGDAVKRLAITADLLSVVGVSIATIVGALLAIPSRVSPKMALEISVVALIFLAGLALVLAIFIAISAAAREMFAEYWPFHWALQIALWAFYVAILLGAGHFAASMVENSFFRTP